METLRNKPKEMIEPFDPSPTRDRLAEIRRDTLAWLQEHNPMLEEIPKGTPCNPSKCPIARGLAGARSPHRVSVGANRWADFDLGFKERKLPKQVSRFRAYFDLRKYPDLIE